MRRAWLIFGTLLVVTAVFVVFVVMQKPVEVVEHRPVEAATRPAATTQIGTFGRGAGAWMTSSDNMTGLPKTRFRGEEFSPKGGDQIVVDHPQAEFYLGKDRSSVIAIEGKTGVVTIPGQKPRIKMAGELSVTSMQPPSRGSMRDVTVSYYATREDLDAKRPQHTLTLNNAYFDNETFEIATEEYVDADGKTVAAREVPVQVRGEIFDFDGKGLLIRWDDRSERLRSLTVFQGERLVIKKDLDELRSKKTRPAGATGWAVPSVQLVAADKRAGIEQAAAVKKNDIYRATFAQGVAISQEEKTLATAEELRIDFMTPGDGDEPKAEGKTEGKTTARASKPAESKAPAKPKAGSAVKKDVPITIRWGGPLTVTLAPDEPMKPLSKDDAVVYLAGSEGKPVQLDDNGRRVEGMWVAYQTQTEEARVEGTTGRPAKISEERKDRSFVLSTPQLRYFRADGGGKAVLRGPSTAVINETRKGKQSTLNAAWKEVAEATFAGKAGESDITGLKLRGDVQVTHARIPQFRAGVLDLRFVPAPDQKGSPVLKQIDASGDVNTVLVDHAGESRNVRCQNLMVALEQDADGEPYPTSIDAEGEVYAGDDRTYIKGQKVRADLAPKDPQQKKDEYEFDGLRNLRAQGGVEIRSERKADGKSEARVQVVKAERVNVVQESGRQHVVLEGSAAAPASVQDNRSLLAGNFVEYDSSGETVHITGGGKVVVPDSKLSKGGKGLPMQVSWTGPAVVSGPRNLVTADGGVLVHYTNAEGVINDAAGDHVEVLLAPKPPSTQPAEKGMAFLSERAVQQFVLSGAQGRDIRLRSLTPGENGTFKRQVNLLGPRLECYLSADGKMSRMEIPAPAGGMGRMLYVQLPDATKTPAKPDERLMGKGLPGATAFAWRDRLLYDASKGQVLMRGDVLVRHEPQTPAGKGFEVHCDTAIADIALDGGNTGKAELGRLVLTGRPVQIQRGIDEITSPMVEYNPKSEDVFAIGSQQDPVRVERGTKTGSFERVRMNLKTNDFEVIGAIGQTRTTK